MRRAIAGRWDRVAGTGWQGQFGRDRAGTGQKGGRRITGPNDASRVLWALGKFFSFVFILLTIIYRLYLPS